MPRKAQPDSTPGGVPADDPLLFDGYDEIEGPDPETDPQKFDEFFGTLLDESGLVDISDVLQAIDKIESRGSSDWAPFPKQALAWELAEKADELLFGGAAGPGKTEWLIEYAIAEMERFANNHGVIFRRVYPSLLRSIIPRIRRKLPAHRAKWNGNDKTFTFPNGSILEIASLQYVDDTIDYQGAEYGLICFEEITEFTESQWEDMIARLRPPDGCNCRPHAIATANPGGRGHVWVKRRFIRPDPENDLNPGDDLPEPTDIWRPAPEEGRHTPENPPLTRCFVPATMDDNPVLMLKDPGYRARVMGISDKGKRQAFLKGDWDAIDRVDGALWTYDGLEGGRIRPGVFESRVSILERVVSVDPSDGDVEGDGYGVTVCAKSADSQGYVEASFDWKGVSVQTLARQTIRLFYQSGADAIVIEKNHGGKWLPAVFKLIDPNVPVITVWASDGKRTRARPISMLMEADPDRPIDRRYTAHLVGHHPKLEEELCTTIFDGKGDSPNRLDAMVWGLWYLLIRSTLAKRDVMEDQRLARR